MEVLNDLLGFKDLKIYQSKDMFNFSLDSVLLSQFATVNKRNKLILDIGTGNAPIPLILSTKTKAKIIGVEIQKEVYELGVKSIKLNKLDKQIKLINADIKEIYKKYESDIFDLILCNPPYFKVNEKSNLNKSNYKTIARHEKTLNLETIFLISKKLLKNKAPLALVSRPERLVEIINLMLLHNIIPKKIQFVYPKKGKEANVLLIEGRKNGNQGLKILEPIYVYNKLGNYTKQIKKYFE